MKGSVAPSFSFPCFFWKCAPSAQHVKPRRFAPFQRGALGLSGGLGEIRVRGFGLSGSLGEIRDRGFKLSRGLGKIRVRGFGLFGGLGWRVRGFGLSVRLGGIRVRGFGLSGGGAVSPVAPRTTNGRNKKSRTLRPFLPSGGQKSRTLVPFSGRAPNDERRRTKIIPREL